MLALLEESGCDITVHDPWVTDEARAEGKRHQHAVIALVRRRVTVLHAMLGTREPYQPDHARKSTTAA